MKGEEGRLNAACAEVLERVGTGSSRIKWEFPGRQKVESVSDRRNNIQGPLGTEMKGLLVVWCGWSVRLM